MTFALVLSSLLCKPLKQWRVILSSVMAYKSGSRDSLHNPKNGTQRVVTDTADGSTLLYTVINVPQIGP